MDGQGNLERTWRVRKKSGNLKINGNGGRTSENLFFLLGGKWQWWSDFRNFIFSIGGKDVNTFSRDSRSPSPSSLGATLKGKN